MQTFTRDGVDLQQGDEIVVEFPNGETRECKVHVEHLPRLYGTLDHCGEPTRFPLTRGRVIRNITTETKR